jgi:hypothetical protein
MKAAMQKFTEKIVSTMKAEKLFETQGGPIILSQVRKWVQLVFAIFLEEGLIIFLKSGLSFLRSWPVNFVNMSFLYWISTDREWIWAGGMGNQRPW